MLEWVWVAVIVFIVGGVALAFTRLRTPRNPDIEKEMTEVEIARGYDEMSRGRLFRLMRYVIAREVKACRPSGVALDVGCGPGYVTRELAGRLPDVRFIGVDNSPAMLDLARSNGMPYHGFSVNPDAPVDYLLADAGGLPFRENSVDFILSTGALHHWRDAGTAIREFHRILRPGGEFLLVDLRRDIPRVLFYVAYLAERYGVPAAVKAGRGMTGSILGSYTPGELSRLVSKVPFGHWLVGPRLGWLTLWARKNFESSKDNRELSSHSIETGNGVEHPM